MPTQLKVGLYMRLTKSSSCMSMGTNGALKKHVLTRSLQVPNQLDMVNATSADTSIMYSVVNHAHSLELIRRKPFIMELQERSSGKVRGPKLSSTNQILHHSHIHLPFQPPLEHPFRNWQPTSLSNLFLHRITIPPTTSSLTPQTSREMVKDPQSKLNLSGPRSTKYS